MVKNELLNLKDRELYPEGGKSYQETLPIEEQQLVEEYLAYRSITFNVNKLRDVRRALLNLRHVLDKPLTFDFTIDDIKVFLKVLYNSKQGDAVKKSYGEYLFSGHRAFMKWRFKDWSQHFNNFQDESGFRLVKWKTKPLADRLTESDLLTEDEVRRQCLACDNLKHKALIILHGVTPGRTKEIRLLQWKGILFDPRRIRVFDDKTQKPREMPINDTAVGILRRWYDQYTAKTRNCVDSSGQILRYPAPEWFVFPGQQSPNQAMSKPTVWTIFKRAAKKAGITKNVYGYLNRHSTITRYQQQGVDIRDVANIAGHSSIKTTLGYTHINKSHSIAQVVKKVFENQQISFEQEQSYKKEIETLKAQLKEVLDYIGNIRDVVQATQQGLQSHNPNR